MASPPIVVTVESVRDELPGEALAALFAQLGSPSKVDRKILEDIRFAQAEIERDAQTHFTHRVIRSRAAGNKPDGSPYVKGIDYDYEEDKYTWFPEDWDGFSSLRVRRTPIQSVEQVAVIYGQSEPRPVIVMPDQWVVSDHARGIINIQPVVAMGSATASSMVLLPILNGDLVRRDLNIPLIVAVNYTAGYLPAEFDPEVDDPWDGNPDQDVRPLLLAVKYRAAALMLTRLDTSNEGEAGTVSVDGSSETVIPSRFAKKIDWFDNRVNDLVSKHVNFTRGPEILML